MSKPVIPFTRLGMVSMIEMTSPVILCAPRSPDPLDTIVILLHDDNGAATSAASRGSTARNISSLAAFCIQRREPSDQLVTSNATLKPYPVLFPRFGFLFQLFRLRLGHRVDCIRSRLSVQTNTFRFSFGFFDYS